MGNSLAMLLVAILVFSVSWSFLDELPQRTLSADMAVYWEENPSKPAVVVTKSATLKPHGQRRVAPTPITVSKPAQTGPRQAATAPVSRSKPAQGQLSRAQVVGMLENACDLHGVAGSDREWLVRTGVYIVFDGGRGGNGESTGYPSRVNGQYVGLFQFGSNWAGDERYDPQWSCNRFVQVFTVQGKAGIRQHWKATVGPH